MELIKPEEKAKELIESFQYKICSICGLAESDTTYQAAKEAAIICVDEIKATEMLNDEEIYVETKQYLNYWLSVKEHLTKS